VQTYRFNPTLRAVTAMIADPTAFGTEAESLNQIVVPSRRRGAWSNTLFGDVDAEITTWHTWISESPRLVVEMTPPNHLKKTNSCLTAVARSGASIRRGTAAEPSAVIDDIRANPGRVDAVWQQNQVDFQMTGQGGVPTMSWKGEPFFGQDRFDQFFWRLRENGLTKRKVPREPIVAQPLRWPSSPGGE